MYHPLPLPFMYTAVVKCFVIIQNRKSFQEQPTATTKKPMTKTLSLKELLTDSSAKDCERFFVTKRRSFEVIVDTITKSYNEFVIKKSHKI